MTENQEAAGLRAELRSAKENYSALLQNAERWLKEMLALRAKVERLRADAERLAHLFSKASMRSDCGSVYLALDDWIPVPGVAFIRDEFAPRPISREQFDAAIDAARSQP